MSALGQTRRFGVLSFTSGLPPTLDISGLVVPAAGLPDFANKIINLVNQLAAHRIIQRGPLPTAKLN